MSRVSALIRASPLLFWVGGGGEGEGGRGGEGKKILSLRRRIYCPYPAYSQPNVRVDRSGGTRDSDQGFRAADPIGDVQLVHVAQVIVQATEVADQLCGFVGKEVRVQGIGNDRCNEVSKAVAPIMGDHTCGLMGGRCSALEQVLF